MTKKTATKSKNEDNGHVLPLGEPIPLKAKPMTAADNEEKLKEIVGQEKVVNACEIRWSTAKRKAKEAKEEYTAQVTELRRMVRDSRQGNLFPAGEKKEAKAIKEAEKSGASIE